MSSDAVRSRYPDEMRFGKIELGPIRLVSVWKRVATIMRICRFILVIVGLTLSVPGLDQQRPASSVPGQSRNLSEYDKAGPFSSTVYDASGARTEATVREFLWNHWKEKRRGYLTITPYSVEGDRTDASYFVEPSKEGSWRVQVTFDRTLVDRRPGKHATFHKQQYFTAYALERFRRTPSPRFSDADPLPPEEYELIMKGADGKEILRQ